MHPVFPGEPAPVPPRQVPWRPAAPVLPAGLMLAAGVLHLLLVQDHLGHARAAGLLFLGLGMAQAGWAAAYLRFPSVRLANAGLAFLVAAPVALYAATRVWRAPWQDAPEAVDAFGLATVALELAAGLALLAPPLAHIGKVQRKAAASAVLVGLMVGVAGYGAALAAEPVPWLGATVELGHSAHGADGHGDAADGGHDGHGTSHVASGVLFAGARGHTTVGNLSYFGPTTGQGIQDACQAVGHVGEDAKDCWTAYLQHYLASAGAVPAFEALVQLTETNSVANNNAHPLAHLLGYQAYHAYGLDIGLALRECSYELFQGCLHGALQSHFQDLSAQGLPVTSDRLNAVCAEMEESFERYVCEHGMGHGVHMHTGYELEASLDLCAQLTSWWARENCYGGVHMENVVGYFDSLRPGHVPHDHGHGPPTYWVDANDTAYPCNAIDDAYGDSCWRMQTSLVLHFNGGDFAALSAVCDSEAGQHRLACHNGVGREAAPWAGYDAGGMSARCGYGDAEAQAVCVKAFTAGTILQFNSPQRGLDLCPQLPGGHQEPCYWESGRFAQSMLGEAAAVALCDGVPEAFRASCHGGRGD